MDKLRSAVCFNIWLNGDWLRDYRGRKLNCLDLERSSRTGDSHCFIKCDSLGLHAATA